MKIGGEQIKTRLHAGSLIHVISNVAHSSPPSPAPHNMSTFFLPIITNRQKFSIMHERYKK